MQIKEIANILSASILTPELDVTSEVRNAFSSDLMSDVLTRDYEKTGGKMLIRSEKGAGTTIEAQFISGHPDLQPMGDIEGCWVLLAASHPAIEVILRYRTGHGEYDINSKSVMEYLELDSLSGNDIMNELRRMIRNNIDEISLGVN